MKKLFFLFVACILIISCKSVDFDKMGSEVDKSDKNPYKNSKDETKDTLQQLEDFYYSETLKTVDIAPTVVYVEKPVYYPVEEKDSKTDKPTLKGKDATKESTKQATKIPQNFTNGTMYYDFDNDFTYEIYCQPYRVTDLTLEPGEQVIEMPFLSESQVWEIGAGVSRSGGIDTQHFFLKPAYSGLETSFIIITDKRVYHFMLKSFKDCYMTQVRFNYPRTSMPFNIKTDAMEAISKANSISKETVSVDPKFLSFDYKMKYSFFKKPYWLPYRVYDDGKKTYITMNETVLHMASPVMFNHRNERINYSVDKNLIIINELIEKITLQLGKEKVTIQKKNYKEPKQPKIKEIEETPKIQEEPSFPVNERTPGFQDTFNSKASKETLLHSNDISVNVKMLDLNNLSLDFSNIQNENFDVQSVDGQN